MLTTRCISLLARTAMFATSVIVAAAQTGIPDSWGTASQSPDLFVKSDAIEKRAPRSILLIGENHASVKTQIELADFLETLYNQRAIDAILVEGSNGFIDASDLRGVLTQSGAKNTAQFWKGQLALGQIAGYEYVALTRDGVRVWGIEDMDAKRQYAAGAARRDTARALQQQADLHRRGLALVKNEAAQLDTSARQGAGLDTLLESYGAQIQAIVAFNDQSGKKLADAQADIADGTERITTLYAKLKPVLPVYGQFATAAESYNKLVEQAKKLSQPPNSLNLLTPEADVQKLYARLTAAKTRLETAKANLDAACHRAGYPDVDAVDIDLQTIQDLNKKLDTIEKNIQPVDEKFGQLESGLTDQFFLAANAARTAAGHPLPAVQNFLLDERQRARSEKDDPETPFLSDRDLHMVANTRAYLAKNPSVRNVALIIGYAHLQGMTNRLRAENVNVVAGKIAASTEENEDWENRAWERRSRPVERVFSRETMKELARLLDNTYKQEVPALVKQLDTVSLNSGGITYGKSRIFETNAGTGGRKAIVVTSDLASLHANWGSQIVDLGILPDGSNNGYLVVNRGRASQEAKTLTTAAALFAPAYRTRTADGTLITQIDLPDATVSLSAFKARVPKSTKGTPQRVILAAEGDSTALITAIGAGGKGRGPGEPPSTKPPGVNGSGPGSSEPPRKTAAGAGGKGRGPGEPPSTKPPGVNGSGPGPGEPPRKTAAGASGNGRGPGEPPWTTASAHFAEPPDGRLPFIFFTKNMRRAKERVETMDKQEALTTGAIATFEIGFGEEHGNGLNDLWFTPERGDHARAFCIAGDNTPEFRQRLKDAADAGLLRNKQIALATCFDSKETDALRETLLDAGALMVWTPENRISPEAARKLASYMKKVDGGVDKSPPKTMEQYINRALELWYVDSENDPDLRDLLNASQWVELLIQQPDRRTKSAG